MNIIGAQINVTIGALEANREKVINILNRVEASTPTMVVFPELTLTGYPPADLLLRKGFVADQIEQAEYVRRYTKGNENLWVVLGIVTENQGAGKPLRNTLVVYHNGEAVFTYHKQLLPTYDVFDEARYFEPGAVQQGCLEIDGQRYGFIICEDAWNDDVQNPLYGRNPVEQVANTGVDFLVTINASPSHVGKYEERYDMYVKLAKKYGFEIVYVNQVGAHDALVFDGYSFVATADGIVRSTSGYYEENLYLDTKRYLDLPIIPIMAYDKGREVYEHLVLGIRDYIWKNGFRSVVVGCSGGIDSAVVLALATAALGPENVFAITMPSEFSSEGSVTDSEKLCKNLGIKLFKRAIGGEVRKSIENYQEVFGQSLKRLTIENMQARVRGRILMEYSNNTGAMVLSTGNKTETSVGYTTLYGDTVAGLNVLGDLYKMEVYALAKWINSVNTREVIPAAIIEKAPSAELWENQKDTDSLPPYPILDALLKLYIERDCLTPEEVKENTDLVKKLSVDDIEKYLRMTDGAEFKRQQSAPILRVHKRAFGAGRVIPITQKYKPSYKNVL